MLTNVLRRLPEVNLSPWSTLGDCHKSDDLDFIVIFPRGGATRLCARLGLIGVSISSNHPRPLVALAAVIDRSAVLVIIHTFWPPRTPA